MTVWSDAKIETLAATYAKRTLQLCGRERRGSSLDGSRLVRLASTILGGDDRIVFGASEMPARLVADRTIVIPKGHPDIAFAVGHELGHWAWRHMLNRTRGGVREERFANAFAAWMLRGVQRENQA